MNNSRLFKFPVRLVGIHFVGILFLYAGLIFSQESTTISFYTPISEAFDFGDGEITDITEDWNGFTWVATTDGLFRFDGTEVKSYHDFDNSGILHHSHVYSILVDQDKKIIWLGTRAGLVKFDPLTESATHYTNHVEDPSSLADNLVRKVIQDSQGNIWASCINKGLSRYREDTDDFENFFYDHPDIEEIHRKVPVINASLLNSYTTMCQDPESDEILWLGGRAGLIKFDKTNGRFDWINTPDFDNVDQISDLAIIEIDAINNKVVAGLWEGAYVYDKITEEITWIGRYRPEAGELYRVTRVQFEDENTALISFRNGLIVYNMISNKVEEVRIDNPELSQRFGSMMTDSKNRQWIHSSDELAVIQDFKEKAEGYLLPKNHLSSPRVVKLLADDRLAMLTNKSNVFHLFDIETRRWETRYFRNRNIDWSNIEWQDIAIVDEENLFLLSSDRLYQLELNSMTLTSIDLKLEFAEPRLSKLLLDKRDHLWISSINVGLFNLNQATGEIINYTDVFNSEANSALYSWINDLHEDHLGRIWIRLGRSFAVYDPETDQISGFPISLFQESSFKYIRNFSSDPEGNVWISSEDQGLGRTDKDSISRGIIEFISDQDGLISNNISQMDFGPNGNLWILSDVGLSTYDIRDKSFTHSTWNFGLPKSSEFVFLPKGKIGLVLGGGGICVFNPALLDNSVELPEPYITNVTVRDNTIRPGNQLDLAHINVQNGREYLGFGFSALGYLNPKEFAYFFQGVDEDWIYTEERRTASYSNLTPGRYQFYLKSRVQGGEWSPEKVFDIYLVPKWYETTWFKLAIGLMLVLITLYVYRWRLNQVRQKEKIKSEYQRKLNELELQSLRSQMNPHFLYNSLNSIQNFIIKSETKKAVGYLDRFSRLVRLILQNSRSKSVSLKDEIDALHLYLSLEQLRFSDRFEYEIKVDPDISLNDTEIPPMLLQPFAENAILHGLVSTNQKGKLLIKISKGSNGLECIIDDNGIGRAAALKNKSSYRKGKKSMGLMITKERLNMLSKEYKEDGNSIEIIDKINEDESPGGTKVILRVPV